MAEREDCVMVELLPKPKTEVVRRQILVLKCERFLTDEEKKKIIDRVKKEMEDGLVFLPFYLTVITVDEDSVVIMD